ncbi:MAG: putative lipid II flippase FtsW [Clostridia bacterium]|nr:putative lipid II flippase FtsW [Clostridia bacterium]
MNNTNNVKTRTAAPSVKNTVKKTSKPNLIKKNPEPAIVRIKGAIDRPMLVIIILLLCFGSIMVFSSSFATALTKKDDSYYYIKRQLFFLVAGFIIMMVVSRIDYRIIRRFAVPGFIVLLFLLALVPVFGLTKGQAVRWIRLGPVRFQPSEPMKTFLILMLAHYCATYQNKIINHRDFKTSSMYGNLYPYVIVGIVCFLVALEKHFSGVIILFLIGTIVIFAAGARKFWLIVAGSAGSTVVLIAIMFTSYAKARIDTWIHPEKYSALGEVWQTLQGLNAIGSGGFLGVGLGNSYQKYSYVAEPQNDFIFSILCEELGFVGALAVIALFVAFVWRGFIIAMKAPDSFSSLVVIGIIGKVGVQAVLNICVVTALIPNTGITLPFFSYGGSAMMLLLIEMGIVLSVSRYSYQDKQ